MAPPSENVARFDVLVDAVRRNPHDTASAMRAGITAIGIRREIDAISLLEQIFERGTSDPNVPHTLGLLYRALGDLAAAIDWFDRALSLPSAAPVSTQARAVAALEAGLPSIAWFERAGALAPNHAGVMLGHAAALAADMSIEAADAWLDQILIRHPGWIDGQAALIRFRFSEHREDMLAAINRALMDAPRDPRLHHLKIVSLMRAGRAEASAAVATAHAMLGETTRVLADRAIIASEQGQLVEADAAFARINPLAEPELALNWMRHLLRRREPERVAALHGHIEGAILDVAWPYLSLAWRIMGDPHADWLDRDSFVRIIDLGPDWPALADLAALLPSLHRSRAQPLDQSVRGGSQTDGPLLSRIDAPIRALRRALEVEIKRYIAALPPPEPGHPLLGSIPENPRFAGSWSVQLAGGGFHQPHIHNMGWLSSAFYVTLPDAATPDGWLTLGEPETSLAEEAMPGRLVEPRRGRLVLFPSTLWHGTRPFPAGKRLSVAFDVS